MMQQHHDTLLHHLSERIYEARVTRGLSQTQLAAQAQVTPSTVSRIENARTDVTFSLVVALADVLGLELAELVPGKRAAA